MSVFDFHDNNGTLHSLHFRQRSICTREKIKPIHLIIIGLFYEVHLFSSLMEASQIANLIT